MSLSFEGHTVVVTGAGGGLGRAYSLLFAERGANIVVNDFNGEAAQKVVDEIKQVGGNAVVNTSSVTDGAAVIQTAIDAFGGITILVNNAGILRDKGFKNMTDAEFDQVIAIHVKGTYSCIKAAWSHFRNQKFGRIINISSAAGLYGNFGQANYSAAKMGLISFTKSLAREGAKYNISAVAVAPAAASKMTETIMPPEVLEKLKPDFVAPFVAAVCHPDGPNPSGRVFEVGAAFIAEIRWERSKGAIWRTDESFSPSAVKLKWSEVTDFSHPKYPESATDVENTLEIASTLPPNAQSTPPVRFDGQTVIITGAGAGLGHAYALMYGRLGANVVVNDVSEKGANAVSDEIRKAGGKATPVICSAEDGDKIVKAALDAFGGVHVLVANAGVLRDRSLTAMSEQEWDIVMAVHLRGTYKCAKAVWPIFQEQKYGRIVTTCSQVGIYGNFGQTNYCTAKAAIMGLTKTLGFEGRRYNILCNVIAPSAGTAMTMTIWPQEMIDAYKPDYIAPIVGYLSSQDNTETNGRLFDISGGWAAETRWQRAGGYGFPVNLTLTPEDVIAKWDVFTNFDNGEATYPTTVAESMTQMMANFENENTAVTTIGSALEKLPDVFADPADSQLVADAKKHVPEDHEYSYTERDVVLYNLGIGATEQELQWTYEGHDDFGALPTFGVIPQFIASSGVSLGWLPNFNPAKLLHGEQYLSIKAPIPTEANLVNETRLLEVLDKGKAASVTSIVHTKDKATGKLLFENQVTVFIRGAGGFGGKRTGADRGAATAANTPPNRKPDAVVEEKTSSAQAALYRLSGDYNPLHILPEFAAMGGFDKPILHGLCFMGVAGKHVLKTFGAYEEIKVRFAGVVYPAETLVTEMWKEGNKVIFTTKTKERGTTVLASAAVTLMDGDNKAKL
ncbi:NAD(P)-binding protein [Gyrodon lividus]|nr:NAD(P)-binding protein [Gyrodon lividus]